MTAKIISTYYSGYRLKSTYDQVTVTASGRIGHYGLSTYAYAQAFNYGSIDAGGKYAGVSLGVGGLVQNGGAANTHTTIAGYDGVAASGGPGAVVNYGTITAADGPHYHSSAILFEDGGQVRNGTTLDKGALLEGGQYGGTVLVTSGGGIVDNYGSIIGTGQGNFGIVLQDGGSVTNGAASADVTALIKGYDAGLGVSGAAGTVVNFGTIVGLNGAAIYLAAGGSSVTNGSRGDTKALIEAYGAGGSLRGAGADGAGAPLNSGGAVIGAGGAVSVTNYATINGTDQNGVYLSAGGSVTNGVGADTTATISGSDGVAVAGGAGTIVNLGAILGADNGIALGAGGYVANGAAGDQGALISGDNGLLLGKSCTVVNNGTIAGTGGAYYYGILGSKAARLTLTNGAQANTTTLIEGNSGVQLDGPSTVVNFGTIAALASGYAAALFLRDGGRVTNGAAGDRTALITGCYGFGMSGAGTVTNFGTIDGTDGEGFLFESAKDVLVVEAGCAFIGSIEGGDGTLILASGVGTISNVTGDDLTVSGSMPTAIFSDFGVLEIGSGAQFTLVGGAAGPGNLSQIEIEKGGTLLGAGSIATMVIDAGTVASSGGALAFTGVGDTFAGPLGGTEIDFAGGTDDLLNGSKLTADTVGVLGDAIVTLARSQIYKGVWNQSGGKVQLDANTLTLFGAGSSITGSVAGVGGTLAVAGGSVTFGAGAALTVSNWSLTGGTTSIARGLTYRGAFSQGAHAILTVAAGDRLTLTEAASLAGVINGAGRVTVSSAAVSGLTIGGTATLEDAGSVSQTGAVTLGDKTTGAATLTIDAGATWTIGADVGIARGESAASIVKNSGALIKSGGTGVSIIAAETSDTGSMAAATGTLDFAGALTGSGTLTADSGATLEADSSAASNLNMIFNGGDAVLALKTPSKFAAAIDGFAATDTIDLLGIEATSATLGAGDTLVISDAGKPVATLQLSAANAGDTFSVASDGSGGTDIAIATGGGANPPLPSLLSGRVHQFVTAMAGLAPVGGALHGTAEGYADTWRPIMAQPRMG